MVWRELFSVVKDAVFGAEDVLSNRRKQPRILMHLPVRCRLEGPDFPAELVDLGLKGMRLVLPQRVRRQQALIVSALPGDGVAGRPELRCSVIWCRQNQAGQIQAGVVYNDTSENLATSWVHYLLLQRNCPVGERKDRRIEAGVPIEVEDGNKQTLAVGQVVDLSLGGAKIRVPGRLPVDCQLVLKIGGLNPGLKPIVLKAQVVGQGQSVAQSESPVTGQANSDQVYSLKFMPNDGELRKLKRLLHALLKDLRKTKRPKSSAMSGLRLPAPPPPPPRPQGPLAGAVNSGFLEPPPKAIEKRVRRGETSKFLRSQQPDFLKKPVVSAESTWVETNWQPEPAPKWRTDEPKPLEDLVTGEPDIYAPDAPQRPIVEGVVAMQFPRLEVKRGWFHPAFLGAIPIYAWLPDQVARPTEEFFQSLLPMLPGCPVPLGMRELSVWTRNSLGPGLSWANRLAYASVQLSLRRPVQWLISTVRTRERLERRHLSLQERLLHLLAVQGLGGAPAVRSLVACGQIACALAREAGLDDSFELSHLRLTAFVKDIGESTLILGLASKAQRERWSFFLHGVDTPMLELDELVTDWPGFRAKSDLLMSRHSPGPEQLELLPLHPLVGQKVLAELGFPEWVTLATRSHHEAFNGSGYPDGLVGRDIPWAARCLAVSDTFAGMLAADMAPAEALHLVEQASGQMFDPEVVKALRRYLQSLRLL